MPTYEKINQLSETLHDSRGSPTRHTAALRQPLQISLNNKLGVLKRVAYGFVNTHNFAARAILITPGVPS
ncbi:MAG TPA: hypothetical protein ENH00_11010 [Actinobacteria bacterium]|nr:hypothetical protein BMS3Bbin01_02238 [bacterium BMS3Bbin01]HDH26700.1 hypothetical protein [Actinomycetota bacterium]